MITEDEAIRLLELADPARADDRGPDLDATGYLAALRTRSSDMTLVDTEPIHAPPDTSKRRLYIGMAAAAALVAIVVAAIVVAGNDSTEPQIPAATTVPSTPEQAAEQVALRFLAAQDAWDADTARSLVADDAEVIHNDTPATIDRLLEFERVREWRYLQPSCAATSAGPPVRVTCTYLVQSALPAAFGMGPFEGSSTEFQIADGLIRRLQLDFVYDKPDSDGKGNMYTLGFEAFVAWREGAYPNDPELGIGETSAHAALLEQRVQEWKAIAPAIRFMQERQQWDGETVRSLVADDAVIEGDFAVATADDYVVNADVERALTWRFRESHCAVTDLGPPATVSCDYVMQNRLGDALDVGPYPTGRFEFEVADGLIRRVRHEWHSSQYEAEALEPFLAWLDDTHPGDRDVMFDADGNRVSVTTPAALELLRQRLREFDELTDS